MKIAFIGSCNSEQFKDYIFPEGNLVFRAFRINTVSLVDDRKLNININEKYSKGLARHVNYELRKGFIDKLIDSDPDFIIFDFVRDVRCPLIADETGFLSFPYELLHESEDVYNSITSGRRLIHFGSKEYSDLIVEKLNILASNINQYLPDAKVLILDFLPTCNEDGDIKNLRNFHSDYVRWMLRCPSLHHLCEYFGSKLNNAKILQYRGGVASNDLAKYGATPIHYSDVTWRKISRQFDKNLLEFVYDDENVNPIESKLRASMRVFEPFSSTFLTKKTHRNGADVLGISNMMFAETMDNHLLEQISGRSTKDDPPSWQDVFDAYVWILGRPPEDPYVMREHLSAQNKNSLRQRIIRSPEFRRIFKKMNGLSELLPVSTHGKNSMS